VKFFGTVQWAGVPEAAIDEDGRPVFWQDEIRSVTVNPAVQPKPETKRVYCLPQHQFRRGA
jgi:hypothetical protein